MSRSEYVHYSTQRHLARLWVILTLFLSVPTNAEDVHKSPDDLTRDQLSVRELMHFDTEQALTAARHRSSAQGVTTPDSMSRISRSMSGDPRLVAIYGVGRALMAEVVLDQITYLYRRGQALPVGVAPGEGVYMLQSISSACIKLKTSDASHHLCLQPKKWAAK